MPSGTFTRKLNTSKAPKKKKETKGAKALKIARRLEKNLESHKMDQNGASATAGYDFAGVALSNTSEGDTSSNRNGLKIYARALALNYEIQWSADANKTDEAVRIMVVRDKMASAPVSAPAVSDILEVSNTYSTLSQRNNTTEGKRYQVLYDRTFTNPNQDATNTYTKIIKKVIPLKFPIYYVGSGSGFAAMGRNNLFLYFIGDQTVASALSPLVRYTNRLYFDP